MSDERLPINPDEKKSLRSLQRGAFAKSDIKKGQVIELEEVFFAFPPELPKNPKLKLQLKHRKLSLSKPFAKPKKSKIYV